MIGNERGDLIETALDQVSAFRTLRMHHICGRPFDRDISLPQIYILATLHELGSMNMSELAQMFRMSLPSASSIVDRMADRGYLERVRTDADRRVVTIGITEKGRTIVEEFVGMKREMMLQLFSVMSDDELRLFTTGIQAFKSAIDRVGESIALSGTPEPVASIPA